MRYVGNSISEIKAPCSWAYVCALCTCVQHGQANSIFVIDLQLSCHILELACSDVHLNLERNETVFACICCVTYWLSG